MLNEWIEINPLLKELGCDFGESHPNFKRCPKKKGFIIYLDRNGNVEDVDLPDFNMETVYRWQRGKKDPAFPVFNCRAFYEVTSDPERIPRVVKNALKIKESKSPNDEMILNDFIKQCNDLWGQDDLRLIGQCLKDLPTELQNILDKAERKPPGYSAYKELVRRAGLCDKEMFKNEVRNKLIQKLVNTGGKELAEGIFALKKKGKKKGRGKEHGRDFLYLLTLKDWKDYEPSTDGCPPHNPSFQSWMARIFEEHSNKLYKPTGKKDAFGHDMAGAEDNYDDINAAGLGQIKLFAANEDIPCLMRYGLEGTALFPAGRIVRELARKTLSEYVLSREREGKTWRSIRKYENRNTVAFAYCTKLKDANIIQVFDSDDAGDNDNIYISEEATKTALKTFEGIIENEPAAEIVIGIIAAVDKGNSKFLASRHYPLSHYMSGAVHWQAGCANIPGVVLPRLSRKEVLVKGALPIYPTRAVWLLNSEWRRDGEMIMRKQGKQKVPISKRFPVTDALDFLFEEDKAIRPRIDAGLESIIEKSAHALIMARMKAILDQNMKKDKLKFKDSHYLHMVPTLYGMLLYKKGIRKEDYMKEDVFYLGRFFAVIDKLHIQYSLDVRNGDVPLRLIGNDHVSLALQNPLEAFVSVGRRMEHPYLSWAKRVKPDTVPRQAAKNCLNDIADITGKLTETQIPTEINDDGKAKLILGYLSYGAKEEETVMDLSNIGLQKK
jgi:hypothetical protein